MFVWAIIFPFQLSLMTEPAVRYIPVPIPYVLKSPTVVAPKDSHEEKPGIVLPSVDNPRLTPV